MGTPPDELGAADVTDAQLRGDGGRPAPRGRGRAARRRASSRSTTTCPPSPPAAAGGSAATPRPACARAPFRFFVKQVQSWARSPFFQFVPEELRELAVGRRAVADRGRGLPLRPGRPAARRADDARARSASSTSTSCRRRSGSRRSRSGRRRGTWRGTSARRTCSAGSPASRGLAPLGEPAATSSGRWAPTRAAGSRSRSCRC